MNSLGIRVTPCSVVIAIYDVDNSNIVNVEDIKIPKALPTPEALKYIRNSVLDILREFNIGIAGLRIVESNSKNLNIRRIEIEGVIQEAFASSMLLVYFCGQISTIVAKLNVPRADFKLYVHGKKQFEAVENWGRHNKEEREAILTAIGAANA
ncbi:hypothetical protein [Kangiella koreensis]|uniref:Uncharacterized protein n=1 Tax=Kangiella koreensis (strain DSM 16069 / JCM 12317 / KCTC 12182 / SW-125) TaxID=523791 RepID=C7R6V6_KANKD|nr:hypothetical protein [Kangiella koreensis]ACV25622.1 conserved hypothetical protein [Kangiella koreensis DSM 16069]